MRTGTFLVAFLAVAGTGAGAPIDFTAQTTGPARLAGDVAMEGRVAAFTLERARNESGHIDVVLHEAEYQLVEYPTWVVARGPGHPAGEHTSEAVLPARVVESGPLTGRLTVSLRDDRFELRLLPDGAPWAWTSRSWSRWSVAPPAEGDLQPRGGFSPPAGTPDFAVPPALQASAVPLFADLQGGHVLFAYGADVAVDGPDGRRTLRTGRTVQEVAKDPADWYSVTLRTDRILVVAAGAADVHLASDENGWRIHLLEGRAALDGGLELYDGRLEGRLGQRSAERGFALVQVQGRLDATARLEGDHQSWTLGGEAGSVAVDGVSWSGAHGVGVEAALVGGLLAVALAAWAAYAAHAHAAFGLFGHRRGALDSPTRVEMLRLIGQQPGITTSQLARRLGIARQSAATHVHRLQHAQAIDSLRRGNKEHHQLNSRSYRFFVPATSSADAPDAPATASAVEVLACLSHPLRREFFRLLRAAGRPLSYPEVAAAWTAGPAPGARLLRWHAQRLADAGALRLERAGRRTRYAAAIDDAAIVQIQAGGFLRTRGLADALRSLAQRPGVPEPEAVARIAQATRVPLRTARERLRELHAFGFVDVVDGLWRPAPHAARATLRDAPRSP